MVTDFRLYVSSKGHQIIAIVEDGHVLTHCHTCHTPDVRGNDPKLALRQFMQTHGALMDSVQAHQA
jgi:mono/diheme cytochrome c family protein